MASIAAQYPEAKALCDHTNSAANETRTIWFGFLTYGTFLVVAVSGTTHKMLFLQTPISLPILSIELDLVGFYVAAPLLLVVLHLYLLVKLVLLSESYANFEAQVEHDIKPSFYKAQIRKHLNTTIFLQALKERHSKHGLMKFLSATLLVVTLVDGPIFALFYTQIRFLPYQSEWITWFHRFLLAADIMALALAYEAVLRNDSLGKVWIDRSYAYPAAVILTLASFLLITFPDERIDANPLAKAVLPIRDIGPIQTTSLDWPFSTTLKLANEQFVAEMDIVDPKKLKSTLILRRRSLIGADLQRSDLRKAVFDVGDLRGVKMVGARLNEASFRFDRTTNAPTRMQGANLERAQLQGVRLDRAQLQGANLSRAQLQGAHLEEAQLQGAKLERAELQGAHIFNAQLQGADLFRAQLQGAELSKAQLRGAYLRRAQLQGANLIRAGLQGADLSRAGLQGADLSGAKLEYAAVSNSIVWRANTEEATFAETFVKAAKSAPVRVDDPGSRELEPLDDTNVLRLTVLWLKDVPEGDRKTDAKKRLEILYPDARTSEKDRAIREAWQKIENESVSEEQNRRARADFFTKLACPPTEEALSLDPADIADAFTSTRILVSLDGYALTFADALLDPSCTGHDDLSDGAKSRLKQIVDNSE